MSRLWTGQISQFVFTRVLCKKSEITIRGRFSHKVQARVAYRTGVFFALVSVRLENVKSTPLLLVKARAFFFFYVWLLDLSDKYVKILFERDSIFKHVL